MDVCKTSQNVEFSKISQNLALDTICNSKLLQRLFDDFWVRDTAIKWIDSYVSNHQQFVKMCQSSAPTTHCASWVQQESVLWSLLFATYLSSIADDISSRGMLFHQYADTQFYVAAKAKVDIADALEIVSSCTNIVQYWFLLNDLKLLFLDKPDAMVIGTRIPVKAYPCDDHVDVAGISLKLMVNVKFPGVTSDRELSFGVHVNLMCRDWY